MRRFLIMAFVLTIALCHNPIIESTWAQGVLIVTNHPSPLPRPWPPISPPVPQPPQPAISYKIKELAIHARITDQVARAQVTQSFVNTGTRPIEAQFLFPLPYDGAIDSLTLLVDGKEIPGKLMPARDARSVYESIVRSNRDPALLEWIGQGLFQTNVFPIPPGAERKVILSYNQLLKKDRGLTDFLFPLSTARYTSSPVEKTTFDLTIESSIDIKNVYSPTHTVEIKRPDARHAIVSSIRTNEVPTSDFRLMFDVDSGSIGASLISYKPKEREDGFYLLLASPQVKQVDESRPPKTVVFVVDRSGSMSGKKFEQARAALKFVLNNLRDGDLFNIVAYDGTVESFRPELDRYSDDNRKSALGFIEGLHSGGGTNIHGALTTALSFLKDSSRPNYVLFLTDGLPTVGVTEETKICQAAKQTNAVRARILSFGVGYDVNSRLLDRLSRDGFGTSEYVRPDEDIEAHVSKVYKNISAPVLTDVAIRFEIEGLKVEDGPAVNRVYPAGTFDLFEGQQLVVVGRYRKPGSTKIVVSGHVGSQMQSFEFPSNLVTKSVDESYAFVEKLWAMRRIGEIIDQLDLNGRNEELVKELVELSTKHGILTPYTSFLADENVRPLADARAIERTQSNLGRLNESLGVGGVAQRSEKKRFQEANNASSSAPIATGGAKGIFSNSFRDISTDKEIATSSVRQYGNKAVYARRTKPNEDSSSLVVVTPETSQLDLEKDRDQFEVIERYSDAYFALVQSNSTEENQILSQQRPEEQLLLRLRGKNYLFR